MAVSGPASGTVGIHIGNGDGTFGATMSTGSISNSTYSLAIGDLDNDGVSDIGVGVTASASLYLLFGNTSQSNKQAYLRLFTKDEALSEMQILDDTLARISAERGAIGATQSRLQVAASTLTVSRENFDAAASRITDSDVAQEAAEQIRLGILQQASASVLLQANQQPALALQLLSG